MYPSNIFIVFKLMWVCFSNHGGQPDGTSPADQPEIERAWHNATCFMYWLKDLHCTVQRRWLHVFSVFCSRVYGVFMWSLYHEGARMAEASRCAFRGYISLDIMWY